MANSIILSRLNFGKVDAKLEFSEANKNSSKFFDSYLIPENVQIDDFKEGRKYFISGFRGTGKTSLLRYFLYSAQSKGSHRRFVLFKSDIDEDHRVSLSKQVGYDYEPTSSSKMELSQDFKSAWRWFILHKIGELINENISVVNNPGEAQIFLNLFGLGGKTTVSKALGIFPKLDRGSITIEGDVGLLAGKLELDFESRDKSCAKISIRNLVDAAEKQLLRLVFTDSIFLGFDELEAFFTDPEKFKRDLSMVRDLLFVVDQFNQKFRSTSSQIYLITAIRSEVLHSMKALGQEVERSVHDSGVKLSWHNASRSMNHPLLNIIRKKLNASGVISEDPLIEIMPSVVSGETLDKYLLDNSFYKPRDIVWRLTLIQSQYPNATSINQQHFQDTLVSYSQQMWSEIAYELNASYSADEVDALKMVLSGFWRYFDLEAFRRRVEDTAVYSSKVRMLQSRRDLIELLHNLYRLGAIGNDFSYDNSSKRRVNRWSFRGEPDLLIDRQMAINAALWRALSTKTIHGKRA